MRRLGLALAAAWAASCGVPASDEGRLGFDLFIQRAVQDKVGSLQVSMLHKGSLPVDCATEQHDCLKKQIDVTKLIDLTGSDGKQHKALTFPLDLLDGGIQDLTVKGIPVGQGYVVVIEALTRDNPPNLYGSSCNYVTDITAGDNQTLIAAKISAPPGGPDAGYVAACDPRFE